MSFQGRFLTKGLDSIRLEGEVVGSIKVHAYGADGLALLASGTTVPTDTTSGFAKGCLFIDTDVGAGSSGIYENVGTTTSCNFDQIGANTTLAAGGVDTDQLAADAVDGTKIEDDAVDSEHIAAGAIDTAHLANGAGLAALVTAGLGASAAYDKTTAGAQTLLAANGSSEGARAVLIVVVVDETFAAGDGGATDFDIGETDSTVKFKDGLATGTAGDVLVYAGSLTEEKALLVTATAATGTGTGGISATVLALPAG